MKPAPSRPATGVRGEALLDPRHLGHAGIANGSASASINVAKAAGSARTGVMSLKTIPARESRGCRELAR